MNKICGFCKNKMTIKLGTEDSNFTFYTYDCKLCANSYDVSYRQLINKETDQLLGVTFGIEEFYVILNFDLYPVYQEANWTYVYKNVEGSHIRLATPIFKIPYIMSFKFDDRVALLEKLKKYTLFS
jgi:hypothetical protein